ncbi:unnamed protein product [Darwinula stevensoni]|uniref:Dipeptidase n=1 Tax=Darwinula stevensoni TaxID=69355 RepID=A0A7R8XHV1_9CRUS|nr:unnamed protein product [Darwinula stevensoni]CAG0890709.1 unnamed protein product [Darwinula stevensoni]
MNPSPDLRLISISNLPPFPPNPSTAYAQSQCFRQETSFHGEYRSYPKASNGTVRFVSDWEHCHWDLPTPPSPPPAARRSVVLRTPPPVEAEREEMEPRHWIMIGVVILVASAVGLGVGLPLAFKGAGTLEDRLKVVFKVLDEVPLVDGHNDMPWNIRNFLHNQLRQVDLSANLKNVRPWSESAWSHTDLRRLREGRVGAQRGTGVSISLPSWRDECLEEEGERELYPKRRRVALSRSTGNEQGHNDMPWNIRNFLHNQLRQVDLSANLKNVRPWSESAWSHTDLRRLREGRVGAQFWSAYAPCPSQYLNAVQMTLEQMDLIKRIVKQYEEYLAFVDTSDGVREAHGSGRIGSLIGIEGGHSIGNSLAVLRMFYDLGARYLTLTHSCNTPWAEADARERGFESAASRVHGLTPFGEKVVKEMNRLGMLVDLSHTHQNTMRHALKISGSPVMFSHSAAASLCNHSRNVPDDVIRSLALNGGIIMVPFYPTFISCSETGKLKDVIDHINHIRDLAGIDHVGIGSDFDGINSTPSELEDVSKYPYLLAELLKDPKWSASDLKKLAGLNFLRVFSAVERVSREMKRGGVLPEEDLISTEDLKGHTNCTYSP